MKEAQAPASPATVFAFPSCTSAGDPLGLELAGESVSSQKNPSCCGILRVVRLGLRVVTANREEAKLLPVLYNHPGVWLHDENLSLWNCGGAAGRLRGGCGWGAAGAAVGRLREKSRLNSRPPAPQKSQVTPLPSGPRTQKSRPFLPAQAPKSHKSRPSPSAPNPKSHASIPGPGPPKVTSHGPFSRPSTPKSHKSHPSPPAPKPKNPLRSPFGQKASSTSKKQAKTTVRT